MNMPIYANDAVTTAIDKAIVKFQTQNILNADILIAKDNAVLCRKSVGFADIERKRSFTEHTIFPIASISKQFTAVAILLLLDEGKIDLHQSIARYLPEDHPLWQGKMPTWANIITSHHLLTHSSGLVSYTDEKIESLQDEKDILPLLISYFKDKPLKFKPGSQFDYSNTGYLLLSVIIENISGKSLSEFLQSKIFQPLDMTKTSLPNLATEMKYIDAFPIKGDVPIPYIGILNNSKPELTQVKHPFTVPLQGGAAMFSTLHDLRKWNDALYHHRVLSERSFKLMTTPHIHINDPLFGDTNYGYGIFIDNKHTPLLYKHGGWIEGVRAMLSFSPKNQTTVIVLSNVSPDETQPEIIMNQQANAFNDLTDEFQRIVESILLEKIYPPKEAK
ncbi:MAG: beta-lactamase family protein [Gammaproteobacteria bacterium]|jgi:CubicO group peptidase (beta-lactamase class C family)|nr:beta-lactamase family protein [Gammaproteobacteria bacterium]